MLTLLKNIFIKGLVFGTIFFVLSFLFAYTIHMPLKSNLSIAISIGLAALVANGVTFSRFNKSVKKLEGITTPFQDLEFLKLEAPANHYII